MSLLSEMEITSSEETVGFNTGTLFDLASGKFEQGIDGKWILDGGLSSMVAGFVGANGMYKTTFANSLIMRSMGIYDDAECIITDTENTIDRDKERARRMAEEFDIKDNRIAWLKGVDYDLDSLYRLLKDIAAKKMAKRKEYLITTPFVDYKTGEALKVWKPTYIFIDSLTELVSSAEEELINGEKGVGLGDKASNTVYMLDGNKKTMLIRTLRRLAQRCGLVIVCTGHYDKKIQMDMYSPNPKETQFGKMDYATKGCGPRFKFLTGLYVRTAAALLQDSNKGPMYPKGTTPASDINEVQVLLERCKANNSGSIVPFIVSQSTGLLNTVTNYHYLKANNYYGMNGNKQRQQSVLLPDLTISRNTIRELSEANEQLRRALEVTAQLKFIKNNWVPTNIPCDLSIEPQGLFDKLTSDKNKGLMERVLTSRGYWTYTKNEKEYLSIFEILNLVK